MSKRKSIGLLLIVALAVTLGVTPSILRFVAESGLIQLKHRGIRIQADGINGFLFGVSAQNVEGWVTIKGSKPKSCDWCLQVPDFPVQLRAESVKASGGIRLFLPQPFAKLTGILYGGAIDVVVANLFSNPIASGTVNRLDLSLHPQLRALGIEQGIVDVTATNHPISAKWESEARYTLRIQDVELAPPRAVTRLTGISRLQQGQIDLSATITPSGALTIETGSFDSSLASGKLNGTATLLPSGALSNINCKLELNLNRQDSNKVATWLPMLTNQAVSSQSERVLCTFRSASCSLDGVARLGSVCIRASCAGS
jgi:hypothetical protein